MIYRNFSGTLMSMKDDVPLGIIEELREMIQ